jgi:hypothetical protein
MAGSGSQWCPWHKHCGRNLRTVEHSAACLPLKMNILVHNSFPRNRFLSAAVMSDIFEFVSSRPLTYISTYLEKSCSILQVLYRDDDGGLRKDGPLQYLRSSHTLLHIEHGPADSATGDQVAQPLKRRLSRPPHFRCCLHAHTLRHSSKRSGVLLHLSQKLVVSVTISVWRTAMPVSEMSCSI